MGLNYSFTGWSKRFLNFIRHAFCRKNSLQEFINIFFSLKILSYILPWHQKKVLNVPNQSFAYKFPVWYKLIHEKISNRREKKKPTFLISRNSCYFLQQSSFIKKTSWAKRKMTSRECFTIKIEISSLFIFFFLFSTNLEPKHSPTHISKNWPQHKLKSSDFENDYHHFSINVAIDTQSTFLLQGWWSPLFANCNRM